MAITLKIPEDVGRALRIPNPEKESRLIRELAFALYDRQLLSFGKARELAGLSKWQFHDELGVRHVSRHYGMNDFAEDLAYGQKGLGGTRGKKGTGLRIANSKLFGMWKRRNDIGDSVSYARTLRIQSQTRADAGR